MYAKEWNIAVVTVYCIPEQAASIVILRMKCRTCLNVTLYKY